MKTFKKIPNRQDDQGRQMFEISEEKTLTKTESSLYTIQSLEDEIAVYEDLIAKKKEELNELKKL